MVSVDSGIGHLAAALGVRTLALYGPTDAQLTGCRGASVTNLTARFACAPCLERHCGYRGAPQFIDAVRVEPACFATITPECVWQTLCGSADRHMKFAFCVFKYFPFGGISRDLERFVRESIARGHVVRVYTLSWEGPMLEGVDVVVVPAKGLTNHARYAQFARWVAEHLREYPVDLVVGMNKMPGIDVYYAGDSCYEEKSQTQRNWLYRATPRYRLFSNFERAVFGRDSETEILTISEVQTPLFRRHYGTQWERLHPLPPGIDRSRRASVDRADRSQSVPRGISDR